MPAWINSIDYSVTLVVQWTPERVLDYTTHVDRSGPHKNMARMSINTQPNLLFRALLATNLEDMTERDIHVYVADERCGVNRHSPTMLLSKGYAATVVYAIDDDGRGSSKARLFKTGAYGSPMMDHVFGRRNPGYSPDIAGKFRLEIFKEKKPCNVTVIMVDDETEKYPVYVDLNAPIGEQVENMMYDPDCILDSSKRIINKRLNGYDAFGCRPKQMYLKCKPGNSQINHCANPQSQIGMGPAVAAVISRAPQLDMDYDNPVNIEVTFRNYRH